MSETPPPSADKLPPAEFSPPPNWDHVPFDVGCARCGHDLRGLTDPICPACGLTFDWAVAVPIERLTCVHCDYHLYGLQDSRCPECGKEFTWAEVLAEYHRRRSHFFEYRWRDKPIRSFIVSCVHALRPRKLWGNADIQAPVHARPLFIFVTIALFLMFAQLVLFVSAIGWTNQWLGFRRGWGPAPTGLDFLRHVQHSIQAPGLWSVVIATFFWFGAVLASLLVFLQSMRRCRVLPAHVIRVWAYSVPVVPVICVTVFFGIVSVQMRGFRWFGPEPPLTLFLLAVILHASRSIHVAYRDYLKMPHAAAVACSSQVMALLGATAADYYLTIPTTGGSLFFGVFMQVLDWTNL